MKKKVAFFVSSLDSGGIENYLLRFLSFYKGSITATVYCKSGRIGDLKEAYESLEVKIVALKMGYTDLINFFKYEKELKKENYDTVCDFTGNFAGLTMLIAFRIGVTNRVTFYRGSDNHFNESFFKLLYNNIVHKLVDSYATDILSNSKTALLYFYPGRDIVNDQRFEVIYNGIDSSKFLTSNDNIRSELNITDKAFVVGHIGRFNSAKNHITIIEVAVELCRNNPNICFVLCGSNVDEKLRGRVEQENLGKQIKLLGYRSDVIKILNTFDCFYFPSITEGQPNALIEALVVGLPFVASDILPIKETIPQSMHGQLIPPTSKSKAIEKIMEIYNQEIIVNLKEWSINNFNAKYWFDRFYKKI